MPRVLLVRAGALGDLLLLRRTIVAVQRAGWRVGLLAPAGPAEALLGSGPGDVEDALDFEAAAFASLLAESGLEDTAASRRLRRYDVAIAFTRSAALLRGLGRVFPTVVPHDPQPPPEGPHASWWLASCLTAIGASAGDGAVPVLAPSAEDEARAGVVTDGLPERFLAIHPGSGAPAKNWPAERFAALVRSAAAAPWLLVRGPADDAPVAALEGLPGARVARGLPLRVLAAVLARAGAFVGNDSGVTHLAAAAGARTVALFGPTDPRLWAPVGPRVTVLRAGPSMESIAVDAVSAAVAAARG